MNHNMSFLRYGPDVCTLCYCIHTEPFSCTTTTCTLPYFCKNFRVGEIWDFDCMKATGEDKEYQAWCAMRKSTASKVQALSTIMLSYLGNSFLNL
ncbi:CG32647 [Drosophila busckii]|uniref:CG32647 n=1 Tax=Drosophila busckii TaxID=30019 RepID=A0A0M3QTR8_DROBS|nr:CG32647 [Drosophila busckii]